MVKVTDHAIVRNMERAEGVDVENVRDSIVKTLDTPGARRLIEFAGDSRYKIKVGHDEFCMVGSIVVTFWRCPRTFNRSRGAATELTRRKSVSGRLTTVGSRWTSISTADESFGND